MEVATHIEHSPEMPEEVQLSCARLVLLSTAAKGRHHIQLHVINEVKPNDNPARLSKRCEGRVQQID